MMLIPFATAPTRRSPATAATSDRWAQVHSALDAVVLAAGRTPLDDDAAWRTLAGAAQDLIRALVDAGRIPRYLAVEEGEPNVVVARTLAVVARRVGCER